MVTNIDRDRTDIRYACIAEGIGIFVPKPISLFFIAANLILIPFACVWWVKSANKWNTQRLGWIKIIKPIYLVHSFVICLTFVSEMSEVRVSNVSDSKHQKNHL